MNRHLLELQLILIQSRWGRIDEKWKFILQGNSCRHPIKSQSTLPGTDTCKYGHSISCILYILLEPRFIVIKLYIGNNNRRFFFFFKWPIQTKLHGDKSKWKKELLTVKDAWLRLAATFSPSVKEHIILFSIIKKCSVTMGYSANPARLRHLGPSESNIPQRPTELLRIVVVKWRASWSYSNLTLMYFTFVIIIIGVGKKG